MADKPCKRCGSLERSKNRECRPCKNERARRAMRMKRWGDPEARNHNIGRQGSTTPRPTLHPTPRDLAWTAGFLEGEGSFQRTHNGDPRRQGSLLIQAPQVNAEPLYRLQSLFGGQVKSRIKEGRSIHTWYVSGARARGLAMTIYVLLSAKRQQQIRYAMRSGNG